MKILEYLINLVNLNEKEEVVIRFKIAEYLLNEAKKLLDRGDTVQSSEKLYKVAEECLKIVAYILNLPEVKQVKEKHRWTLSLFDKVASRLSELINERIYDEWDHAYFLHVESFHEMRLGVDEVRRRVKYIEELLEITRKVLSERFSKCQRP